MLVTPITTDIIQARTVSLHDVIDASISAMQESSILVVTSKVVSLCEGRVVAIGAQSREELITQESAHYLPPELSKYGHHFSITDNTLIASAGIDESNGGGNYVLWPEDSQATANAVRKHLCERFGLRHVGVIITDSTSQPLRLGTIGIVLAHSGFLAINDYIGKPDLFDRPFEVNRSNVAGGLAAAAVVTMGEGSERTPLCLIQDVPFVQFQDADPTEQELAYRTVPLADDLFEPFLRSVPWQPGRKLA